MNPKHKSSLSPLPLFLVGRIVFHPAQWQKGPAQSFPLIMSPASRRSCFPVLSFLHVPGKMSQPLWLMMGTAFRVCPQQFTGGADLATPPRPLFLTAKHTFAPWDFTKSSDELKIPVDYRKARYVIGRMYSVRDDAGEEGGVSAVATEWEELSLISAHPSLDVALLSLRRWPRPASSPAAGQFAASVPLPLLPPTKTLKKGAPAVIEGFRGAGRLGELDTFDPALLQQLPPAERESLIKELQNVEGRQVAAATNVEVLDPLGMCRGVGEVNNKCFHGMSGGPVVVAGPGEGLAAGPRFCAGILYGKHPDHPLNIGYTPSDAFAEWLAETVSRLERNASRLPEKPADPQ